MDVVSAVEYVVVMYAVATVAHTAQTDGVRDVDGAVQLPALLSVIAVPSPVSCSAFCSVAILFPILHDVVVICEDLFKAIHAHRAGLMVAFVCGELLFKLQPFLRE